ncbi:MAG: radical SAM protein [Candidatus Aminicenantes bacterium]|nr:radical SAM protein [Candidatus Aminicenantes bacterium]
MKKLDYWWRLFQAFKAYHRHQWQVKYPPLRLWLEPTSLCNLRCPMCPNRELKREEKGFMEMTLFKKIIEEARDFILDLHLYHRGESLLHPKIIDMIKIAKEAGLFIKLHTNATVLTESLARGIIDAGLDQLTFSFDGFDKATYEKIRVNGRFEKTVANILRFLEIKKERKAKKPITILELIAFPELYSLNFKKKKKAFLQRFRRLPLDRLEIRDLHNWAGETGEPPSNQFYSLCPFLWLSLVVLWDGTVLPCTQDFHGFYPLGRVGANSLLEIWNSPALVELRKKIIDRNLNSLETCSRCDRLRRPTLFGVPRDYFWKMLLRRMS